MLPIAARPTSTGGVKAARAAFDSGVWRDAHPLHKKKVLLRFAELIRENVDETAFLETLDFGKVIANSISFDVPFCANCIQYYAERGHKLYDEVAPVHPHDVAKVRKEPLGVGGAIAPSSSPLIIAAGKPGPALVAGNSFILKPAEQSPIGSLVLGTSQKKRVCRTACSASCRASARRRGSRSHCTPTST
jgi:4-(gamma-glutamylamino)butanal dehydrogenase